MKPKNKNNKLWVAIVFSINVIIFSLWFGFIPSAKAADCCGASGDCMITVSPCDIGGSFANRNIGINVNTANPVTINLTGDLDLRGSDLNFENAYVGANRAVVINGKATASTSARNIDMTGGDIRYPNGGLTIDLSVPDGLTGNGGDLDITGAGGTSTFIGNSTLKIYTQGNGTGFTGGHVYITFTSNTLLSGASLIKTGNTSVAGVNGGLVDLTGSGNIGIESSNSFISTSSSRKAGDVSVRGSGSFRGGIHANSCEGFGACGQNGGTIDLTGLSNYYTSSCVVPSLEAKNNGIIKATTGGSFDLSQYVTTGGGDLDFTGPVLSNCSCCSLADNPGSSCTGGAAGTCRYELGLNNTVNFTGVDCNAGTFPAPNCSSSNNAPMISITEPDGDAIPLNGSFNINYSLNDSDNVVTAALYYDNDGFGYDGTAIASCASVPESAGAICIWNTTGVIAGTYYVYGITTDGLNQVQAYSGPLAIGTSTVQFSAVSSSGPENVSPANLQVSLSGVSGSDVTVDYAVTGGTAIGGGTDFTLANGTATIMAGNLSTTIPIAINNDSLVESNETIIVTLSNPVNSILGANTAHTFTIIDDDATVITNLDGFAWSDNIGWISFSSKDCDLDGNGSFDDAGAPSGCPVLGTAYSYGVWKSATNDLAGYAWSDNIGWVSFESASVAGCPSGTCQPRLSAGEFQGWARACSVFLAGCSGALKPDTERGGWDGWISLNCDNNSGCASSNYNVTLAGSDLVGWAWGSDVVGWISFCSSPTYCVGTRAGDNKPLVAPLPQTEIDYCTRNLPGAVNLRWEFNDLEDGYGMQTAYEIEITRSDAAVCSSGKRTISTTSLLGTEINNFNIVPDDSGVTDPDCANFIAYGGYTYTWKVRVFDSQNNENEGGFKSGDPFPYSPTAPNPEPTPMHEYPIANFSVYPTSNWIALMPINFDPFDTTLGTEVTRTFGGSSIAELEWDFGDTTTLTENPVNLPYGNDDHDVDKSDYVAGIYTVDLRVKDSSGYECWASQSGHAETIEIMTNKPKWNEAAP